MKKKKSIIVTGAAGCLGSNFCQWVLDNRSGLNVIAIDDLTGGQKESIPEGCEIYIRDCGDPLDDIFEKYDVAIIFHMAAIAAEALSPFMRKHYYTNNIVNSANIINYAIKYDVGRLVYFSSMAVYGRNDVPFIENQVPAPVDCYGIGKYCVEMDLESARQQHGLRYSIIRPHSIYGPGQNIFDAYRNVLGIFMRQILNNEPCSIYGDGLQKRAFTYVGDVLETFWVCGVDQEALWEIFNVGSDEEMTILEALETLEEVTGIRPERKYFEAIHEVKNAYSDHSKARTILGLECKTSLKEGLTKMWEWAQYQPKRELQTFDSFELEVGLYEQFKK